MSKQKMKIFSLLVGITMYVTSITVGYGSSVIKGSGPSGFAATNGMAFVLLIVLIIATIVPLLNSKMKNAKL